MTGPDQTDVAIVGGGPGGIIALYYARLAGLNAVVLEKQDRSGGLWAKLPAWQDIQNRPEDWTLGDIPIEGVDQPSILKNIHEWIHRFSLAPHIRLGTNVLAASPVNGGWLIETSAGELRAKALISATGVHNRPVVPKINRENAAVDEVHSSALRDPSSISGKEIIVVGGGASAFDLIDLCFEQGAAQVRWVYRTLRWMVPTRKEKRFASNLREMAKRHMLDGSAGDSRIDPELRDRYMKFGIDDLLPDSPFDIGRDQLIPGRWRLIENLEAIERHRDEITAIENRSAILRSGIRLEADMILWGTGYEMDLSYLSAIGLHNITRPDQLAGRCGSMVLGLDAPNLYFVSVGLESTSVTPWHYAHLARTIVSHICGTATLGREPVLRHLNYFGVPTFLAAFDPTCYPPPNWRDEYLGLVTDYPNERPFPIPRMPAMERSG